jgi:hypothetical protein
MRVFSRDSSVLLVMLAFRLNAGRISMTVELAVLPVVIIWQVVYIARAIRRFYFFAPRSRAAEWTVSAVAAPVVYLLNSLFITVLQFAGAAFAITRLQNADELLVALKNDPAILEAAGDGIGLVAARRRPRVLEVPRQ